MIDNKKILIVDDEEDLCEILKFNLESEGYITDIAHSAEEGLNILSSEHQIILLDVMMEGMSGFKMAESIRKEKGLKIPIIFLTAKDTENDMLTGFSVGGDDYISKPFSIKEVSARIKAVLKRSDNKNTEDDSHIVEYDNIIINILTKSVLIKGNPVILTKKEFEILLTLMKHPNRVFSREEILSRIWSNDSYVLERTVDVHITRLRKKLGDYGRYIINRSGYGYCFET